MIEIFYLDNGIKSEKIKDYSASSKYSEIRIGNKTVEELIRNSIHPQEIKIIDDLSALDQKSSSDEILIFSASVFSKDLNALSKFLKFSGYSMINAFWGSKDCFVYKGDKDRFISFLRDDKQRNIFLLKPPKFILDLTSLPVLKSLLSSTHDSRHFNEIKSSGDLYIKKSSNVTKLKSEFDFLENVPDHLTDYFVKVFEFAKEPDFSQYSMVSHDIKDVSYLFLSNRLNEDSFKILMTLLQKYFEDAKKPQINPFVKNSFEDLLKKNVTRLNELKELEYYESLNSFLLNFKGISISDHHLRIQKELKRREKTYRKENYIFSHGDLCFSNILFSAQDQEIKLIDPKGYENSGMRSPYYDMAKLSHSIFGYYDLIINNKVVMGFDEKMRVSLDFSKFDYIKDFEYLFVKMVSRMKLDMTLIRLIESSLFLSMIPFHYENKRKAFRLCLRSVEVYESLSGIDD